MEIPGGYLTNVNMGRLRSEVQPLAIIYIYIIYHFGRKGTLFIYLLLKKSTPFTYVL